MATRNDVARLAGVSPSVVSYVLNGGPRKVAAATRVRVLQATDQLGYRPNQIAASLRRNRTMTLGLVVPDNTNAYFAELAREIEDVAFGTGYTLLLGNANDDADRESAYIRSFLDRRVDGIMLIPSRPFVPTATELERTGTPWVVIDRGLRAGSAPAQVFSDNRQGGRLATEHLIAHGRRRIACISGPRGVWNTNARIAGWRDALLSAGLEPDRAPLRESVFGRFAARRVARDIIERNPDVDAVFVASDEQAVGVLRALAELGVSCPDDIAVVSFDGVSASSLTSPSLTTVQQPLAAIASGAIAALARQARSDTDPEHNILPVDLMIRESCGCQESGRESALELHREREHIEGALR